MATTELPRKAVFFDRDGVLNKTTVDLDALKSYAPTDPEQLEVFPEAYDIIKQLKIEGFAIIIVSNQPDIALNKIDEVIRKKLEEKFVIIISQKGVQVDRIYYCNHHPNGTNPNYPKDCDCRKPKPGMILQAAVEWSLDLKSSWMIGDTDKDINAGQAAGCKTILLVRPWSVADNCQPDYSVDNLEDVLDIILPKDRMSVSW